MIANRITSIAVACLIAGLVTGLFACEQIINIASTDDTAETPTSRDEIEVGLVIPLTGITAVPFGISMQRGFHLAQHEINNSQSNPIGINFITEDNGSTVEGTIDAFQRLIDDEGVPAIVGIAISTRAKEAFPIAQENRVVAFSPLSSAAGLSGIGDYIFRAALATDILNPAGVRATHASLGYERVAMIYDEADVYSTSSNEELSAILAKLGVEVLLTETVQTGDTDFSAQLTALKESNPDALFVSALPAEVVRIMSQGRELGIPSSVPYIIPELTEHELALVGDAAEGAITFVNWSPTADTPGNQTFVQNFRATYGLEPDMWAAQSYATLYILHNAFVTAGAAGATNSTGIRDALAMTRDFDTILGSFSFDPNGEALYEPIVLIANDGKLQFFGVNDM